MLVPCMTSKLSFLPIVLLSVSLLGAVSVIAEETTDVISGQFSLAVGIGRYTSPQVDSDNLPIYLLPRWSYYCDRFYVEDLDLGFNLIETELFSWDITTKQSFDALMFHQGSLKDSLLAGFASSGIPLALPWGAEVDDMFNPTKRHMSYLGGTTMFFRAGNWKFKTAYHTDISNVHGGSEWASDLRYLTQIQSVDVAATVGVRRLDRQYSNYYFGLSEEDTDGVLINTPGAQWLPSLKLELSWAIRPDLRAIGSWRREWLADEYQQSYFIDSNTHDIWFIGVMKTW